MASKSKLMAEIVERVGSDAINAYIANNPDNADALRKAKQMLLWELRNRIERPYVMLEILDTAAWHPRKVKGID